MVTEAAIQKKNGSGSPTPLADSAYILGHAGNRLSVAELGGRTVWKVFYDSHLTTATKQELLDYAKKIDDLLGDLFTPPIR